MTTGKRMESAARIRVGAVQYLNTRPLVHDLPALAPQIDLYYDLPSRLADRLAAGELDVALIPSVEFFQRRDYVIVSDACIACRGPVWSVKLFFRVPPQQVRTLALDEGSRTSAALARVLLAERYAIYPELSPLPLGAGLRETQADAVLLIGDRAMHAPAAEWADVWDLGDEWRRWTQLPFVFAMWVARAGTPLESVEAALSASRDRGVEALEQIAAVEAPRLGLSRPECLGYLRDHLYFYLGEREWAGLELFYRRTVALGLAPEGIDLGWSAARTA